MITTFLICPAIRNGDMWISIDPGFYCDKNTRLITIDQIKENMVWYKYSKGNEIFWDKMPIDEFTDKFNLWATKAALGIFFEDRNESW